MILQRIYPLPAESVDGNDRSGLLDLYRPPRADWLRLNLVASVTGAARGVDGTSETLSNPVDRRILGVIRELADIVLVGAQSLRAEGYQQPRRTRLAVVTFTGNLLGHRIEAPGNGAPIVICPPAATRTVRKHLRGAEILELPAAGRVLAASAVIGILRERGFGSIVCEGGPSLAGQLLDAGLVDEFCLATSPRVGGTAFGLTGEAEVGESPATLGQLLMDESSGLYARWLL